MPSWVRSCCVSIGSTICVKPVRSMLMGTTVVAPLTPNSPLSSTKQATLFNGVPYTTDSHIRVVTEAMA